MAAVIMAPRAPCSRRRAAAPPCRCSARAPPAQEELVEVFEHPSYGRALRARVKLDAGTRVMTEAPLLITQLPLSVAGEGLRAFEELQLERSLFTVAPELVRHMLAFCLADAAVQQRVLQLFDGGDPAQWPSTPADTDLVSDELVWGTDDVLVLAPRLAAWCAERAEVARGVPAATLARVAAVFAFNSHGTRDESGGPLSVLFERSSKFSHACGWAANTVGLFQAGVLQHVTVAPVAAGEMLCVDYHCSNVLHSTRLRRHLLRRFKRFDCRCAQCTAPDVLTALPCPACVPRSGATGLLPRARVLDARGALRAHPVVVKDDDSADRRGAWRCTTCGCAFTHARLDCVSVAAGQWRPQPRSAALSAEGGAASLLDCERWAEAAAWRIREQNALPAVPEGNAGDGVAAATLYLHTLTRVVGTAHVAVTQLRVFRLLAALQRFAVPPGSSWRLLGSGDAADRARELATALSLSLKPAASPGSADAAPSLAPAVAAALVAEAWSIWALLRVAGCFNPTSRLADSHDIAINTARAVYALGALSDRTLSRKLQSMLTDVEGTIAAARPSVRVRIETAWQHLRDALSQR